MSGAATDRELDSARHSAAEFAMGMALRQATGLDLLRCELEALLHLMPGLRGAGPEPEPDDRFDNLPV